MKPWPSREPFCVCAVTLPAVSGQAFPPRLLRDEACKKYKLYDFQTTTRSESVQHNTEYRLVQPHSFHVLIFYFQKNMVSVPAAPHPDVGRQQ